MKNSEEILRMDTWRCRNCLGIVETMRLDLQHYWCPDCGLEWDSWRVCHVVFYNHSDHDGVLFVTDGVLA